MTNVRTLYRGFVGGEVTPEFFGRLDDPKFQMGLALCRNWLVTPHGPLKNRPGFAFVRATRISYLRARLIPFAFSLDQTMMLEFGEHYVRFHTGGQTLIDPGTGTPYEVATAYTADQLFDIRYEQSADVLTLTHDQHPVRELRRLGATNWTLTDVSFVSAMAAPTGLAAVATTGDATNLTTQDYVVTAVGGDELDESVASGNATCSNNLNTTGTKNTLSWTAVSGASRYYVYKFDAGVYGFIGQATTTSFVDDNLTPDISKSPPIAYDPFNATGDRPRAITYFEQRRTFAGTLNKPQTLWATRPGTESNLSYSVPSRDDDGIVARFAARDQNAILHLVPMQDLIALTPSSVVRVFAAGGGPLTPASIAMKAQSYIGANDVRPIAGDLTIVYAASRGGHLREITFSNEAQGYVNSDLSLRAPHLFDDLTVVDLAYQRSPYPIIWAVSSDGRLLGLTYVPEQNVYAFHQHATDGLFESVAVVAEGEEDALYAIVQRTVNGQTVRYVERLARRRETLDAAFFVDAGATYTGPQTDVLTGLSHLEGCTVAVLADGAVLPQRRVVGGAINLEHPASRIVVGLPIVADAQTLPLAFDAQASGQGRAKSAVQAWVRLYKSSALKVGPDPTRLVEMKLRTGEPYSSPPALHSGEVALKLLPALTDGGQIYLRQDQPLPSTVVAMALEASVYG